MPAIYYTAVGLEKMSQRPENRQIDRQRTEKAITVATLLPYQWNAGFRGPILNVLPFV